MVPKILKYIGGEMSVFEDIKTALEQAISYEEGILVLDSSLNWEEIKSNFEEIDLRIASAV